MISTSSALSKHQQGRITPTSACLCYHLPRVYQLDPRTVIVLRVQTWTEITRVQTIPGIKLPKMIILGLTEMCHGFLIDIVSIFAIARKERSRLNITFTILPIDRDLRISGFVFSMLGRRLIFIVEYGNICMICLWA